MFQCGLDVVLGYVVTVGHCQDRKGLNHGTVTD
jgi:hypothetical protein